MSKAVVLKYRRVDVLPVEPVERGRRLGVVWIVQVGGCSDQLVGVHAAVVLGRSRTPPAHLDDAATGALRVVVDRTFPLSQASAAHTYIENREAFGRVLLTP
jgi:NADPH:quinone reductase-like Zn-dependent oxidoreductase